MKVINGNGIEAQIDVTNSGPVEVRFLFQGGLSNIITHAETDFWVEFITELAAVLEQRGYKDPLAIRISELERQNADLQAANNTYLERAREAEAKVGVTMGVGDGSGQLFVHGDYDSIKAAQAISLDRERLRGIVHNIHQCLDGEEWIPATLNDIAAILTNAGYIIQEPQ